mmetsp:Transcript_63036/g.195167  ORF Transcript_63036/g.195167 Transcript_63036/m.195167 type:complete len:499 (-) Transcript_63036:140-1636(-)
MAKLFAAFGSSPLLRSIRGLLSNQPVVPRLLRASMSLDVAATGRDGGPACKELIARWSVYHPTPLARRDLAVACLDQQARLEYGTFLHQELRIRFARRVRFFQQLPYGLPLYPGIRGLTQRHTSYVTDLEDCETPRTAAQDRDFTSLLRHIIAQQSYFEEDLFTSFREFALGRGSSYAEVQPSIDAILQRVVAANIGTKVLMSHHVSSSAARPGAVGVVQLQCDPAEVAQLVARQCHRLCRGELGEAPEIDVRAEGGTQLVALVPGYVHYMLTEVLKNACRAVVERHFGCPLPPATVLHVSKRHLGCYVRLAGGGRHRTRQQHGHLSHPRRGRRDVTVRPAERLEVHAHDLQGAPGWGRAGHLRGRHGRLWRRAPHRAPLCPALWRGPAAQLPGGRGHRGPHNCEHVRGLPPRSARGHGTAGPHGRGHRPMKSACRGRLPRPPADAEAALTRAAGQGAAHARDQRLPSTDGHQRAPIVQPPPAGTLGCWPCPTHFLCR